MESDSSGESIVETHKNEQSPWELLLRFTVERIFEPSGGRMGLFTYHLSYLLLSLGEKETGAVRAISAIALSAVEFLYCCAVLAREQPAN